MDWQAAVGRFWDVIWRAVMGVGASGSRWRQVMGYPLQTRQTRHTLSTTILHLLKPAHPCCPRCMLACTCALQDACRQHGCWCVVWL